jgi:hypothetical protein
MAASSMTASGRNGGAGGADRHGASLPEIPQRRAHGLAPGAIRPLRCVRDGMLELLAGVAAHGLRFAPGLVGKGADLVGNVMAALRQFLGELRVGQSVDERANGLGDVVGRSCRAGRHVVLLWGSAGGWVHEGPSAGWPDETYTPNP